MAESRKYILMLGMWLCCLVLAPGLVAQRADEHKGAHEALIGEKGLLDRSQIAARVELALWSLKKGMLDEAQRELHVAEIMDAGNERVLSAWSEVLAAMPVRELTVAVTLWDGNRIQGRCRLSPFLVGQDQKCVVIRPYMYQSTQFSRPPDRDNKRPQSVQVPGQRLEGKLIGAPLQIANDFGKFDIPLDRIAAIVIKDDLEELAWKDHLAELNKSGLDLVLLFDTNDYWYIDQQKIAPDIGAVLSKVSSLVPNLRVGIVTYRGGWSMNGTGDPAGRDYSTRVLLLSEYKPGLIRFLDGEKPPQGTSTLPRTITMGLSAAFGEAIHWRPDSRKVVLLVGPSENGADRESWEKVEALCRSWQQNTGGMVQLIKLSSDRQVSVSTNLKKLAEAGGGEVNIVNPAASDSDRQLLVCSFGSRWQRAIERFLGVPPSTPK